MLFLMKLMADGDKMPVIAVNILFAVILAFTMKAKVVNNINQKQETTQNVHVNQIPIK